MNSQHEIHARQELLTIFSQALRIVSGRHSVSAYLHAHPLAEARIRVVALGKAAASMLAGAQAALSDRISAMLLITKYHHLEALAPSAVPCVAIEAGHPYPDANSVRAGAQLLEFLAQTNGDERVLFLISGGTSSLVEVLPAGVSIKQLEAMNRWLLASGWPIDRMNQLRKAVSCIKGGRLAESLGEHPVTQLLLSDVPRDDPAVIGSGLLVAQAPALELRDAVPDWIQAMLDLAPPMPAPDAACFRRIDTAIVASNRRLREEVGRLAGEHGLVVRDNAALTGEADEQGRAIAARLKDGAPGLYVWGGETVVALPATPGRGGRCQHLALAAADALAGRADVTLLAVGTDGSDGPGEVAGALIDGGTLRRGREAGMDPLAALVAADAGRFLHASGDLLDTGPTGTNVMDLILGLKLES